MSNRIDALEELEDKMLDMVELMRALFPNFNSIPPAEKVIVGLNQLYRDTGKLVDVMEKGLVK
jgi:hypothetical protein